MQYDAIRFRDITSETFKTLFNRRRHQNLIQDLMIAYTTTRLYGSADSPHNSQKSGEIIYIAVYISLSLQWTHYSQSSLNYIRAIRSPGAE